MALINSKLQLLSKLTAPRKNVPSGHMETVKIQISQRWCTPWQGPLSNTNMFYGIQLFCKRIRSLIWAFAVRICPKTRFRMAWPINEPRHVVLSIYEQWTCKACTFLAEFGCLLVFSAVSYASVSGEQWRAKVIMIRLIWVLAARTKPENTISRDVARIISVFISPSCDLQVLRKRRRKWLVCPLVHWHTWHYVLASRVVCDNAWHAG